MPPTDVLLDVFTPTVREKWRSKPTEELIRRLSILSACGPYPSDCRRAGDLRYWRARKAAWETYFHTSFACGLFEGQRGNDLRRRLASRGEEEFLAAVAECMVCWFLGGKLRLPLVAEAPGRKNRNLDMQVFVSGVNIGVEVKAPFREPPTERVWHGDDSDKITQAMEIANKQFSDDRANILALVPSLRMPLFHDRGSILRAAFGESKLTWDVNTVTGEGGPVETKFFPEGKFLNTQRSGGKPLKPDGLPGYRRISAIVCIEETIQERYPFPNPMALKDDNHPEKLWPYWAHARELHFSAENRAWVDHNVVAVHNPHAYTSISHDLFNKYPQLVPAGNSMQWTDGEKVVI